MCFAWARSEPYILEGNAVLCKEIVFDILEYPCLLYTSIFPSAADFLTAAVPPENDFPISPNTPELLTIATFLSRTPIISL